MDIKDFAKRIRQKHKELDDLMRRKMPVIAGRRAKDHFQDNFRKGGFVNNGLHLWPKAGRLSSGSSAASNYGTLLSSRNHLFSSIKYTPSDYRVRVMNEVPYASVHNWGGKTSPTVTPKMRRFAWAMYYQAGGKSGRGTKGRKSAEKHQSKELSPEAQMWRGLALTKKTKLKVKIPQRQFIGQSRELEERIHADIEAQVESILKL